MSVDYKVMQQNILSATQIFSKLAMWRKILRSLHQAGIFSVDEFGPMDDMICDRMIKILGERITLSTPGR